MFLAYKQDGNRIRTFQQQEGQKKNHCTTLILPSFVCYTIELAPSVFTVFFLLFFFSFFWAVHEFFF